MRIPASRRAPSEATRAALAAAVGLGLFACVAEEPPTVAAPPAPPSAVGRPADADKVAAINRRRHDLQICQGRVFAETPSRMEVRLEITLSIAPTGVVESVKVDPPELRSTQVAQCVVTVLKRWPMPSGSSGYSVRMPLVFDYRRPAAARP